MQDQTIMGTAMIIDRIEESTQSDLKLRLIMTKYSS